MKVDEYSEVVRVVFPIVKHKFLNEFYSRFVIFSLSFHFRLIRIRCGHCYKHFLAAQLLNLALHATFLINFLWICVSEIKKMDRFFWKKYQKRMKKFIFRSIRLVAATYGLMLGLVLISRHFLICSSLKRWLKSNISAMDRHTFNSTVIFLFNSFFSFKEDLFWRFFSFMFFFTIRNFLPAELFLE